MAKALGFDQRELKKIMAALRKLDVKLQKKVFTQSINATTRKVILPAVKAKINARSMDVPKLRYPKRGLLTPMVSHTSAPGTLKKALKVRAIKRSRRYVGRLVATPHRKDLGIDENYPGYYPAFLEYGSSPLGKPPKPYMRGTLEANQKKITRYFSKEARKRMQLYYPGGKLRP